jgi:Asp-tRNA(Asn)/Glu-tRNA(Gln) amidotransferase A subunit family amidase
VLGKLTASQRDIEIQTGSEAATVVLRAEAFAYHQENATKSPELYQAETLRRIRSGSEISASAYISGRRQLDQLRRSTQTIFQDVDLLITPTAPVPPFKISELLADVDNLRSKEILMLHNTRPFNALGLPTISVPCGFTSTGLPIGMQITGPAGGEAAVLSLAHAYEQATDWHKRSPSTG